jgi:hypothetical protein
LEKVRQLLFPDLPAEEGWARIEAAMEQASDPKRLDAIEDLAGDSLSADLTEAIHELRRRRENEA